MAVHQEPNQKRKYIRINRPIDVIVGEKKYKTTDWSANGLSIKDFDKEYDIGHRMPVKLLLPCQDGMLELPLEAKVVRKQAQALSCEFINLSEINARTLFAYIDSFMDGHAVTREALAHRSSQLSDRQERQLLEESPKSAVEMVVRRSWMFNWTLSLLALGLVCFLSLLLVNTISRTISTYLNRQQQFELVALSRIHQAGAQLKKIKVKMAYSNEIISRLQASAKSGAVAANQYSLAKHDLELLKIEKEQLEDLLVVLKDNQRAVASSNYFYEMHILDRYRTVHPQLDTNSGIPSR